MILGFENDEIRKTCTIEAYAYELLPPASADLLKEFLADCEAANRLGDLPFPPTLNAEDMLQVNLSNGILLILSPNHPKDKKSKRPLEETYRVKIIEIRKDVS